MRITVKRLFERTIDSAVIPCGAHDSISASMQDNTGLILLYSYRGE